MASLPAFDADIDLALEPETTDPEPESDEAEESEEREESDEGYDDGLRGSTRSSSRS